MNKPLILVVEDDVPVRNLITTTLKAHDYRFLTAANGESAILEASSHNPEIILLDLGLPDMDGIEVIRKVRTWSNLPIIVISARSEDTDKIEALDAGADDYLTKPFSVEELLARLRVTQRRLAAIQAGGMANADSVFTNGKLKVDYAAGCAYMDGQELHLTPSEYKLLCLLSKNVGKAKGMPAMPRMPRGMSMPGGMGGMPGMMPGMGGMPGMPPMGLPDAGHGKSAAAKKRKKRERPAKRKKK